MTQSPNATALRPVARLSAEAQATSILREYILSGALKPGARLTETPLAEQLGIARATLRLALHRLAAEGLVLQIPYTGWQVIALSAQDIWELWTLRGSLEGLASWIAAEGMTDDKRRTLRGAMDALAEACHAGEIREVNEKDFAFHRSIVALAGHARLCAQYRTVEQQIRLYIATTNLLSTGDLSIIVEDHQPLTAALLRGDPDAAADAAWALNEKVGRKLVLLMADQERASVRPRAE